MGKLYRNFIFDIICSVVFLALGIVMLPPFHIGDKLLDVLLALVLIAYLAIYLFDKVKRARGSVFILMVVEFVILSLIILGLFLQQFGVFHISSICSAFGLVIWLRGVVALIISYLTLSSAKKDKKNLPMFLLYVALVSVGAFMFAKPLVSDLVVNWAICILFFLTTLVFVALTLLYAPDKKKVGSKE